MKRLIITGATGFVAREIVPILKSNGFELLLIGRSSENLMKTFPDTKHCYYDEISDHGQNYDALLHLAAKNNDQDGTEDEFHKANVELVKSIVSQMKKANIPQLVFVSSHHADIASDNFYAKTKGQAEAYLANIDDLKVTILSLPAVYGSTYRGNLAVLHKIPTVFRPFAFRFLSALKPTLSKDKLAQSVLDVLQQPQTGQRIILSDGQDINPVYLWTKRIMDLLAALLIFVGLGWLMILVWCAVKLTSSGPGLFAQTRVGQHGSKFTCYKFRTMSRDTLQVGTHDAAISSITPIGRFLRRTKVDELPQAWNIITNQMSLVGPRPCLPIQEKLIEERKKRNVLDMKPGITGLAQVQNIDMEYPEKLAKLDMQYGIRRSIFLDISLILRTVLGGGQGDKVKQDS